MYKSRAKILIRCGGAGFFFYPRLKMASVGVSVGVVCVTVGVGGSVVRVGPWRRPRTRARKRGEARQKSDSVQQGRFLFNPGLKMASVGVSVGIVCVTVGVGGRVVRMGPWRRPRTGARKRGESRQKSDSAQLGRCFFKSGIKKGLRTCLIPD